MPYVCILECADHTLYVGSTRDITVRFAQHASGPGVEYTKRRLPVRLVWSEEFERVEEAFAWEKRIQGWSHDKRWALISGGLEAVRGWSRRHRSQRSG
jgi:putative endonuclease